MIDYNKKKDEWPLSEKKCIIILKMFKRFKKFKIFVAEVVRKRNILKYNDKPLGSIPARWVIGRETGTMFIQVQDAAPS